MAGKIPERHIVSFFRSVASMMASGIPVFAIFEFLSREPEHPKLGEASGRIAQRLVAGMSLHSATAEEQELFDDTSYRLMEVGYQTGMLFLIFERIAARKEANWELLSRIKSQLTYPLGIAVVTLLGALLIPPLVLSDLLNQVVAFTDDPPMLTKLLLAFSSFLSTPYVLAPLSILAMVGVLLIRDGKLRSFWQRYEWLVWKAPAIGPLWKSLVCIRYLRVFALTYDCGLPVTMCATLSAQATGSPSVGRRGEKIESALLAGGSLAEALAVEGFMPPLALQAILVGQESGSVPRMMERVADMLSAEMDTRIEVVTKLVEPIVLGILGLFVATFALGCLLPIIKLTETL